MITVTQNQVRLQQFNTRFKTDIAMAPQGSAAWLQLKIGVLSASNASKIVAKTDSETRATYMAELVAQIATGQMEEINSRHLDWGKEHEDAARAMFEFTTKSKVIEVPFVFRDDSFRVGCSPDGFIDGQDMGLELKCPSSSTNFVKFVTGAKLKSEWDWQTQMGIWVCDAKAWKFGQYDPRFIKGNLHEVTIERDEKKMKTLDDAVPQFIADMDKLLNQLGFQFSDQWAQLAIAEQAAM